MAVPVLILLAPAGTAAQDRSWNDRGFLSLSGGAQIVSTDFSNSATFTLHAEEARFTADYEAGTGGLFDMSAGLRVWRRLAVGLAVSHNGRNATASVHAKLPHPFHFDRPRDVSGQVDRIRGRETSVGFTLTWVEPVADRIDLVFFGGPTVVALRQELIRQVRFTENYPFDTATFTGTATVTQSTSGAGIQGGVDVTYLLTSRIGVGGMLRFTYASVELQALPGQSAPATAGSVQTAFGFRFRF
jgi:hypothetical protein